ncbi:uncharacterized protein LOC130805318 isoform X6 [Amaranthus tricolor]|uniref:uncharacterized protein LOC130805318 isoform X6 n=1 Tax=Amaranthus tricolor TaxID=29722 RepID=UPI00258EEE10|nr:uncharacterized protein LOC130805318 isoform X6 [Amaranthus tricolor]
MNFIARSEDDSKLFYFFAKLQDGPYPNYHDVKEMCFEEDFKKPQPSDFQVKELCSLETHDSEKKALLMATMDPDGGDVVHASRPQKKLKSIPCLDYPGDHYLDRDQFVDEEEKSDTAQICC